MKFLLLIISFYVNYQDSANEPIFINNEQENAFIQHCFQKSINIEVSVTISVYLTSYNGLLLYYIDDRRCQINVNLQDMYVPEMTVEIGYQNKHLIVLNKICRCKSNSCSHETFHFQFKINDNLSIICNGNIKVFTLLKGVNHNLNLPNPVFKEEYNACVWLINFGTTYTKNQHLSRCFFYFKFGSDSIPIYDNWSKERCIAQCSNGICNGGECIETYHLKPICKCIKSFLNGKFCNQTLHSTTKYERKFHFKILKISWNFKSGIIFKMINRNQILNLHETKDKKIMLRYESTKSTLKKEIPINVNRMTGRVLLLEFNEKKIIAKLKNQINEWSEFELEINEDISSVNFSLINFLNADHLRGDIVYKPTIEDKEWKGASLYWNYSTV